MDDDLDRQVDEILQRERELKASRESQQKTVNADDVMTKALRVAYAKADKAHRIATENVEIKTFACGD